MKTNFVKVLRELKIYKSRSFMAMLGILIGVTCIGFVLSAYTILTREMKKNYMDTNPASVVLYVSNLDADALKIIKDANTNIDIEARKSILARIDRGNGTFGTLYLFAVEDFSHQKVDTFTLEKGRFPTGRSEMALERASMSNLLNLAQGYDESVGVMIPGCKEKSMYLSGTVHAPGLAPASMEKFSYAFLSMDALNSLGYQGWYDEIHLVSYNNRFDREAMKAWAKDLTDTLRSHGYQVEKVSVPEPGKHPHADQLDSLLFLLQAFAAISLLVASIIIINLMNFIMSRQTRQIAIMKATGARTYDIAMPYFVYVLLLSAGSIVLGIPLSMWIGVGYSNFAADVLNFNILSYSIPWWVFAVQIGMGILLPLAASLFPIYRSCRISVKDGLAEKTGKERNGLSGLQKRKSTFYRINTQIRIPLNNTLRKKGRTVLAILALAAGGVLFMTAQNIVSSIEKTVETSMNTFRYNFEVRLAGQYSENQIMDALSGQKNIIKAEVDDTNMATIVEEDGLASENYLLKALPENSDLVRFEVLSHSLSGEGTPSVVINKGLLDKEKWIRPGMSITIEANGIQKQAVVAGIINEVPPSPSIYMNKAAFEKLYGTNNRQMVIIKTKKLSVDEQLVVTKELEKTFEDSGIVVAENWNIGLFRLAFVEHLKIIIDFLSVVALLAIFVGGLSIASAIGISTSERKRELGILRAIGANAQQTIRMISLEGILMGLAGWLAGLAAAYPISIWVGNFFGQIMLHSDLNFAVSIPGTLIWLAISIGVSFLSGLIPARKTAYAPLREMLAYE